MPEIPPEPSLEEELAAQFGPEVLVDNDEAMTKEDQSGFHPEERDDRESAGSEGKQGEDYVNYGEYAPIDLRSTHRISDDKAEEEEETNPLRCIIQRNVSVDRLQSFTATFLNTKFDCI